ncbi:hypothetical protein EJD97_017830 [Solanum chilense]|uniref:Uncharacterized protein n=1 Tax=Solanum chilense TaxID=4083 RepID=A0A6N2B379_SOLCI|nr:hypothetical protein EJD97_017830 [Solanum chilense]
MAPKTRANKAKTNTSDGKEILKLPVAITENEKTKSPPKKGKEKSKSCENIGSGVLTRGMINRAKAKAIDDERAKVKALSEPRCKVKLNFDHL